MFFVCFCVRSAVLWGFFSALTGRLPRRSAPRNDDFIFTIERLFRFSGKIFNF